MAPLLVALRCVALRCVAQSTISRYMVDTYKQMLVFNTLEDSEVPHFTSEDDGLSR